MANEKFISYNENVTIITEREPRFRALIVNIKLTWDFTHLVTIVN